jgi:hypothetical protein
MFKLQRSGPGSLCVRALAIIHGGSSVTLTCVEPQPQLLLLTEQRALATYMQAIGKFCHFLQSNKIYVHFPLEYSFNLRVHNIARYSLLFTNNGARNAILC